VKGAIVVMVVVNAIVAVGAIVVVVAIVVVSVMRGYCCWVVGPVVNRVHYEAVALPVAFDGLGMLWE
jgi:hypothetical protein